MLTIKTRTRLIKRLQADLLIVSASFFLGLLFKVLGAGMLI